MSRSKFVALAVLAALPFACSRDRRDTETPEGMTPASGQWPQPTTTTAPQASEAPMSPNAPSGSDPSGNPHSSEADMRDAPDTIGTGTGGTTGMSPGTLPSEGMATGGTATGGRATGGNSAGGTTSRGTGGRATGGTGMGGTSMGGTSAGGTVGPNGPRMNP